MKKMKKISKMLALIVALVAVMFSCVEDDYDKPDIPQIPIGTVYTIQQVKDFYNSNNGDYTFSDDASIYATVTMDEETDNSYRTIFIQDHTGATAVYLNNSGGVYIGDSIRVYLKGLKIMQYNNLFQINDVTGSNGVDVDQNIIKQGYNNKRTPEEVTLAEIIESDQSKAYYQGRLVKITDVQFVDTDTAKTFANPETLESASRKLQDSLDNQIIVRTSGYATFAGVNVPNGSGSMIAIISQYNNDMQLIIRRMSEVELDNPRFNLGGGGGAAEGTGTFDDPYNVAAAINNSTDEDVWVEGYLVGVYETKDASGADLSNFTPSFTAPFNTTTNVIIADSEAETNISNCIIVQLPTGEIRDVTNLSDNESNLGKVVKYKGDRLAYFGEEGLKNTSGYWLDGSGIIPVTGFYEEDFTDDISAYSTFSITGTQAWEWDYYDNGCAVMSGYDGTSVPNEDWLISPAIDLSGKTNVTLVIREAINDVGGTYASSSDIYNDVQIFVSVDYDGTSNPTTQGTWTELTGISRPAGDSWTFESSGDIDMSAYDGESSFYIAFKYVSTATQNVAWEVGNILLKEGAK